MKRTALLPLALAVVLLAGCSSPAAVVKPPESTAPTVPPTSVVSQATTVSYEYKYANASAALPEGWGYEVDEYEPDDDVEYDDSVFEIEFYPLENPDFEVTLIFRANTMGICGTGVTTEEIALPNGLTATRCTEEMQYGDYWYLLIFNGVPGSYTLECCESKAEFEKYKDDIAKIAESAVLGENIITEDKAVAAAAEAYAGQYGTMRAVFDYINGVWTVDFHSSDGTVSSIMVDYTGRVMNP